MPKTYCPDVLVTPGRHKVYVPGVGCYIMSGSWIDTTAPSDMMDYGLDIAWIDVYDSIRLANNKSS